MGTQLETFDQSYLASVSKVLAGARMGLWSILLGDGEPKFYTDETTAELVGMPPEASPEEMYSFWDSRVDESYRANVEDCVGRILSGQSAEVVYPYHHPDQGVI